MSAYLYLGRAGGVNPLPTALDGSFASVASAGDINGDGFPDLLAGSYAVVAFNGSTPLSSTALVFQDSAYLFLGGSNGYSTSTVLVLPNNLVQNFGVPLASAGRVNRGHTGRRRLAPELGSTG